MMMMVRMPVAGDGRLGVGVARKASHGCHQRWAWLCETVLETTTTNMIMFSWDGTVTGGWCQCVGRSAQRQVSCEGHLPCASKTQQGRKAAAKQSCSFTWIWRAKSRFAYTPSHLQQCSICFSSPKAQYKVYYIWQLEAHGIAGWPILHSLVAGQQAVIW